MLVRPLLLAMSLLLLPVAEARAQSPDDRAQARALAQQADEHASAGRLAEAIELFTKADALVPAPTLKVAIARLLVRQGKLVEAQVLMGDVARSQPVAFEPPQWERARAEARAEAQTLEARLCALELHLVGVPAGAQPRVTVDGDPLPPAVIGVPRVMNPGAHTVVVKLDGFRPLERRIELAEGQRFKLSLPLEPLSRGETAPPAPPPKTSSSAPSVFVISGSPTAPAAETHPRRGAGLLVGGLVVTGVFAATGTVTGLLTKKKADDLKARCPDNHCPSSLKDDHEQAERLAQASTLSFAIAGGGLVVAVIGLFLGRDEPTTALRPAPTRVLLGPDGVGVAGRF